MSPAWYMLMSPRHPFECQPDKLPGYWCYICGESVGDEDQDVCQNEKCLEYLEAFNILCELTAVEDGRNDYFRYSSVPWVSYRRQLYPLPEVEPFDWTPKGDKHGYQESWESWQGNGPYEVEEQDEEP